SIKEYSPDSNSKTHLLMQTAPSWQRLIDVYTSEESDESNHLLSANANLT
ncbi:unnamed protein product, partial [Rotaria socialis]